MQRQWYWHNKLRRRQGLPVDQFKQWLQQQDQTNEASLKQYQAVEGAGNASPENDVSQAAFSQLLNKTMPMTPEQIKSFKKAVDTTQRAVAVPANAPPKPMSSTLLVSLAPGEQPPAIKMSQGFISSLVFVDASGAAWPIQAYDLGNSQAFNVQWDKTSNILMIQPLQPYTYANLAVAFKGFISSGDVNVGARAVCGRLSSGCDSNGARAKQPRQHYWISIAQRCEPRFVRSFRWYST